MLSYINSRATTFFVVADVAVSSSSSWTRSHFAHKKPGSFGPWLSRLFASSELYERDAILTLAASVIGNGKGGCRRSSLSRTVVVVVPKATTNKRRSNEYRVSYVHRRPFLLPLLSLQMMTSPSHSTYSFLLINEQFGVLQRRCFLITITVYISYSNLV